MDPNYVTYRHTSTPTFRPFDEWVAPSPSEMDETKAQLLALRERAAA